MVVVVPSLPTLSADIVSLFYVVDDLLARSPVLVFHGPSATPTAATNNSRIQVHIFTPAGFQSYPRLTVAPSSAPYSAVNCLPREEQGDEICRALAYSLCKYFTDLPGNVKRHWEGQPSALGSLRSAPTLFSDAHAAILAQRMVRVENVSAVIKELQQALAEQTVSWLDMDVVLPDGAIQELEMDGRDSILPDPSEEDTDRHRFGEFASLVKLFGDPAFLPTSKLQRRPSKPVYSHRSGTFMRAHKEAIRREFCELLDTEESYVGKLYDLVHSVAEDFREKAKQRPDVSASPSEDALKGLFPPSLDKILEVNSSFLEHLRKVVEETENEAILDIEQTPETGTIMPQVPERKDVTGTMSLAACMRCWFPRFADLYLEYTKAHSQMPHHLRAFMSDTGSSFSQRMQETGEQRLMSMLIEPVQRLPRYNLYIDNILKQLPSRHAAVKGLLKARDIISEICSHNTVSIKPNEMNIKLQEIVASWPSQTKVRGRLITSVDVVELPAPYDRFNYAPDAIHSILLLFSDCLVVLRKHSKASLGARALMAQLDGTDMARNDLNLGELTYKESFALNAFDITEMDGGKLLQLIPIQEISAHSTASRRPGSSRPASRNGDLNVHVYHLIGLNEGKSSKFCEELVHARVEGRFSEETRESQKWEVRSASAPDLSFFSSVCESSISQNAISSPARIRVVVGPGQGLESIKAGEQGVEIAATLTTVSEEFFRLEMAGMNDFASKDLLKTNELLPVLAKRLNNFLQMRNNIRNPAMVATLLQRNQSILHALKIRVDESDKISNKSQSGRPHSPVKMLASFFSGGSGIIREPGSLRKHNSTRSDGGLGEIPNFARPSSSRRMSREILSKPVTPPEVVSSAANTLAKLEETLSSYLLALQARKGNIVGRILRMRGNAEELYVNELYNALLEDPKNYEVVAQASVDVLFCAFEKFVKIAWHDKIGPIISPALWRQIQSKLDSAYPGDFEDFFRRALSEQSPQNQRAFRACVKLLVELLEGTGNDGDRGMITASFAEVLVPEGNPTDFVSVLDRLVQDVDPLIESSILAPSIGVTPHGSVSEASVQRQRAANSSSISSNTSLRKKFGLSALTRKGSKNQDDEKVDIGGSVWRALSKSKGEEKSSSMSKAASLYRSHSTDMPNGLSPKRPMSRDRPTVLGTFNFENSPLAPIGELAASTGPPRKKRRSSLSDLPAAGLEGKTTMPSLSSPAQISPKRSLLPQPQYSPSTPSPTRQSTLPMSNAAAATRSPPTYEGSPNRSTLPRPLNVRKDSTPMTSKSEEVIISSVSSLGHRRAQSSVSGIPKPGALKLKSPPMAPGSSDRPWTVGGLSERPISGNVRKLPPPPTTGSPQKPIQKLRMQSPQKLRERVQNNQRIMERAGSLFQDEIAKITEEIKSSRSQGPAALANLETKIMGLSTELSKMSSENAASVAALQNDIASSLQVSEARYKKLDELWKETNAENEILYSKFNEELGRVVRTVKGGDGVEEVKKRFAESVDECARLKRENQRLRRENLGLKAQLRDG